MKLSSKLSPQLKKKIILDEEGSINVNVVGPSTIEDKIKDFCDVIVWRADVGHVQINISDLERLANITGINYIELSTFYKNTNR